eukprot:m.104422 g.104422  ORF g.104422 m.104422 type:complete len:183 (-) comp13841_c0_seq2:721-1269(-)
MLSILLRCFVKSHDIIIWQPEIWCTSSNAYNEEQHRLSYWQQDSAQECTNSLLPSKVTTPPRQPLFPRGDVDTELIRLADPDEKKARQIEQTRKRNSSEVLDIDRKHKLTKIPKNRGLWNGQTFPIIRTAYAKYSCRRMCGRKIRTYCHCDKTLILCTTCFADHVAAKTGERNYVDLPIPND